MGAGNCCTSRRPPSPEGLAPRPVPVESVNTPIKGTILATFTSSSTVSRLSKPEDFAEFQAIFNSDKHLPNSKIGTIKEHSSSQTREAVKDRLRKHLSRDSVDDHKRVSKRLSRSSVGTSEEEIERRAELRRIRHKRIQQELSSEDLYDDDAKSLPSKNISIIAIHSSENLLMDDPLPPITSIGRPSPLVPELTPLKPGLTLPPLELPPLDLPPLDLPLRHIHSSLEKGPRLEARYYGLTTWNNSIVGENSNRLGSCHFSSDSSSGQRLRPRSEPDNPDRIIPLEMPDSARSRRFSNPLPLSAMPAFEVTEPSIYQSARKHSSIFCIPQPHTLQPQHLPSIGPSTRSSWRLSFCGQNRGQHLRKLSQGNPANLPTIITGETEVGPAPLDRWLYGQGIRSLPQENSGSDSLLFNRDSLASYKAACCSPTREFGGVDGGEDRSNAIHLHEMGISERLASKGIQSCASSTGQKSPRNTSDSIPLSERLPGSWGQVLEDGASSFYPSGGNSIQPSPRSSHLDLLSLLGKSSVDDKHSDLANSTSRKQSAEDTKKLNPQKASSRCMTSPALALGTAIADVSLPLARYRRASITDCNSIDVSETDSYRQREMELSAIKARFPDSEERPCPSTPRSSKFREEFDHDPRSATCLASAPTPAVKKSAFSRIAKLAVKSYDGPMEKMLGVPLPTTVLDALQPKASVKKYSPSPLSPLKDNDAAGMWVKAVYLSDKAADITTKGGAIDDDKRSGTAEGRKKSNSKDLGWIGKKEGKTQYDKLMTKKEEVMDDWEREMNKTARNARKKSRLVVQKDTSGPDKRFPASWSKFPSFSREQRTLSATANDAIESQDFAVHSKARGKTVWYQNERTYHLHHYEGDNHESHKHDKRKGLFTKLGDAIQNRWPEIDPGDHEAVIDQTYGRRGSKTLALGAEFPELEILPIEIMSNEEIEQHVEEELEEEDLDRREAELELDLDLDAIFGAPVKPKRKDLSAMMGDDAAHPIPTRKDVAALIGDDEDLFPKKKSKNIAAMMGDEADPNPKRKSKNVAAMMGGNDSGINTGGPIQIDVQKSSGDNVSMGKASEVESAASLGEEGEGEQRGGIDAVGMGTSALDSQIAEGLALKKKMDAARKRAGGKRGPVARRGPIARKKPVEQITTEESPVKPLSEPPSEAIDSVGMNVGAQAQQILDGRALKKKMDAVRKNPRGPVARKTATTSEGSPSKVAKDVMDGSHDFFADDEFDAYQFDDHTLPGFDDSELSIADPRYYDDCVSQVTEEDKYCEDFVDGQAADEDADCEGSDDPTGTIRRKGKNASTKDRFPRFHTWSPRNWDIITGATMKQPRKVSSSGMMLLKSTDEYQYELERMERKERDNALKAAEEAWGIGN